MTEPMTSRLLIAAPHGVAMKLRDILATAQIVPSAVLSTGGEALAALEDEQALLLTSWRLPDVSGAELARKADAAGVMMIVPGDYDPAELDGAGLWKKFTSITMPSLRPVTYYVMVNMIIGSFNVFIQVMMLTSGGPNGKTVTLQYLLYDKAFNQFAFGEASAIGLISAVLIVIITAVLNKRLNLDTENEEGNS